MQDIWLAIDPRPTETRILATSGPATTLVKARLGPTPKHPRALPSLLEALALWEGTHVRAALAADAVAPSSGTSPFHEALLDFGGPLYTIEAVPPARRRRRRDGLDGMGDFRDLRQLLLFEVAR